MMTIEKISKDNLDYLYKHSTQEYFEETDNEKGYFSGTLSKWQKMEGKEATKKEYDKLMSFNKDFKGVEIDPSPSKDWTNLYNRVSPNERKELDKIWDSTMQDVAKAIEQNTYYRETKNGKTEYKLCKGAHMAIFHHHTARPVNGQVDGQEHSHIVIFPQVMGQNNKFHSHTLMDLKYEKNGHETLRYFDSVLNHGLAKGLNYLGYAVSPEKDGFTIDGMDKSIRKEFSKRTNQIEELAGKNASYADKKIISLKIRENKSENNLSELRQGWQEKMDELGFTNPSKLKTKQKNQDKSLAEISKEKGKFVFSNKELKTLALQQATFSNKSFNEKLTEFKADKKLEKLTSHQNIYKSNYAISSFSKKVKIAYMKKSLAKSSSLKTGKPSRVKTETEKDIKQSINSAKSFFGNQPKIKGIQPVSNSTVESVEEFLSEIKTLEQELSSLRLDDPKRSQLESKIGDLKNKIKSLQAEKSKNLTAKSSIKQKGNKHEKPKEEEQNKPKEKEEVKKTDEELTNEFTDELMKSKDYLGTSLLQKNASIINEKAQMQAISQLNQVNTTKITVTR